MHTAGCGTAGATERATQGENRNLNEGKDRMGEWERGRERGEIKTQTVRGRKTERKEGDRDRERGRGGDKEDGWKQTRKKGMKESLARRSESEAEKKKE